MVSLISVIDNIITLLLKKPWKLKRVLMWLFGLRQTAAFVYFCCELQTNFLNKPVFYVCLLVFSEFLFQMLFPWMEKFSSMC